jgi:hypothetical protein
MTVRKVIICILILVFNGACVLGQTKPDSLFGDGPPLDIALKISIGAVKDSKKDSVYLSHQLYYRRSPGPYDSINVDLKGRGNFRFRECYFPPLAIKIKGADAKKTVFEGNKKLKLVLPCNNKESGNILILKEFLCYKLYEQVTPYSFQVRLTNIELTELRKRGGKSYNIKGILIEDLKKAANRLQAKPLPNVRVSPSALNDTSMMRIELFQYMISNTDWSAMFQHNTKLIQIGSDKYVSLIYDFDMSGLVNAPYAVVSEINGEQLNVKSVRDRYYRGYCHPRGVMEYVRKEYISDEARLMAVPDQLQGELSDKEIKGIKEYLKEFFVIIKDDRLFQRDIVDMCRAK